MSVVLLLLFFILILGGGGVAYYFLVYKKDEEVDESSTSGVSTTTTPAATITTPAATPRETLLASGQALQVKELEISKNPIPFTTSPTGIDTNKVTYSMSLDIILLRDLPFEGCCILSNNNKQNSLPTGTTNRRPAVNIRGRGTGNMKVYIVHAAEADSINNMITDFSATVGTYFNLTFVIDNGKGTTYINGVKDKTGEWSGAFTWSTEKNEWTWNPSKSDILMNVKNVYWFNKALTADEVKLIGIKQTSGTSTYVLPPKNEPEPYTLDEYGTPILVTRGF
jgi:hypothetical protein